MSTVNKGQKAVTENAVPKTKKKIRIIAKEGGLVDKLFQDGLDKMQERFQKTEEGVVETDYVNMDEDDLERLSRQAYKYIEKIYRHINSLYVQDQRTVLNMMKELYRIAVTGEYSCYQNMDEWGYKHEVFEQIDEEDDFSDVIFAARLLRYYYAMYEDFDQPFSAWDEIEALYQRFLHISFYKAVATEKGKPDSTCYQKERFISDLRKHMDTYMIGQDTLKKKLCVLLYLWIFNHERTNFLIVGPSGSGKNHIINTIASFENLGREVVSYDCSSLTPNGFSGDDVKNIFTKLKAACLHDGFPVEGSIVYLDEVDKIINFNHNSTGESVNAMVQQQLLSCLAGTETILNVDTSKILFILGGAFPRIDELEKKEKRGVGFNISFDKKENFTDNLRHQICEIGGEREFIGRIGEIVKIGKLTRDELKEVLMDETIGVFSHKKRSYEKAGFILEIQDDAIEGILDLVENEDFGARSVGNVMNELADSKYFYDMVMNGYSKMIIHKGMINGEAPVFQKKGKVRNETIHRYGKDHDVKKMMSYLSTEKKG